MELLMRSSQAYQDNPGEMEELWSIVKEPMYSLTNQQKQLGLGDKGITKYFTPNCNQTDSERVNRSRVYKIHVLKCGGGEDN